MLACVSVVDNDALAFGKDMSGNAAVVVDPDFPLEISMGDTGV